LLGQWLRRGGQRSLVEKFRTVALRKKRNESSGDLLGLTLIGACTIATTDGGRRSKNVEEMAP